MTRTLRRLVLGPPAVATLAYPALPAESLTQTGVFLGVIVWSLVAMAVGVRLNRPTRARVWWALVAGTVAWTVGEVLWAWNVWVWQEEPFPSVADAWFLLGYVLLAVGLVWLVRGRQPGRDRSALVDAAVVTLGVGVLTSAFVVLPTALASDQSPLGRVVGSAYPLADLLLLGLLVRLLSSPGRGTAAYALLVAALAATLLADVGYNAYTLVSADAPIPGWMDACWLAYYVLAAAAALHPSMRVLSEPAPEREERLTRRRLLALAAACALAPLTIIGQVLTEQAAAAVVVSALGSLVLSSLVLLRMAGLLQRVRSQAVQLAALASVDGLTGVPNRRTWDLELSRACAAARQDGLPLAVALLDLDRFKLFNDRYGHQAGDRLLREGAAAWTRALRPATCSRGTAARSSRSCSPPWPRPTRARSSSGCAR